VKIFWKPDHPSKLAAFAMEELETYLGRMLSGPVPEDFSIRLEWDEKLSAGPNDCFEIRVTEKGGSVTGKNERSVLLGVYDYLHSLGCRFLLPGKQGAAGGRHEILPRVPFKALAMCYKKEADLYYRGVCIEGADSLENILDFIDWLPKLGFNSFFSQFKSPYAFLSRYYHHENNPLQKPETYTEEDARAVLRRIEAEMGKRGLMLHEVGHGWTGEALGFAADGWNPEQDELKEELRPRAAMLGGRRGLLRGVPTNTNLCYANEEAVDALVERVVSYAEENPGADYLHVWLADAYNNVCECPECVKTTVSDQYVRILNRIDERLTEENCGTRIVFLLYQELLWPPVRERLNKPERFVMMFAPISRTFEKSYELGGPADSIPEYRRNRIVLPTSLEENLAFLRGWQKQFSGDSFVYDYPLGRAHYGDLGYVHIAGVIHDDIGKLKEMGLNGYISCQELRAAFPNALPNYMMGYSLWDNSLTADEITEEYFRAAYGEEWEEVLAYLSGLSGLSSCDYVNGKGPRLNPEMALRFKKIQGLCEGIAELTACHTDADGQGSSLFWELLEYHRQYVLMFSEALLQLATGENGQAIAAWKRMKDFICRKEPRFQPYLDVYRVLEVSSKYTGIVIQL